MKWARNPLQEEVVYIITETVKKRRCKSGGEGCISSYWRLTCWSASCAGVRCILRGWSGAIVTDAWAAGANVGVRLRGVEGKLRPFWGKWSEKSPPIPWINQCQQLNWWYLLRDVLEVLNNHPFLGVFLIFLGFEFLSIELGDRLDGHFWEKAFTQNPKQALSRGRFISTLPQYSR